MSVLLSPLLAIASLASPAPMHKLPNDMLEDAVEAAVTARLSARRSTASVVRIAVMPEQQVPPGSISIDVGEAAGQWPRKWSALPLRVIVDGRVVRRLTARVELHDPQRRLVYGDRSQAGWPADRIVLDEAEIDVVAPSDELVRNQADLIGLRAKRGRRAGEVVWRSDFEPIPDVSARSRVSVSLEHGRIRLSTGAIALEDASIGQQVSVLPDLSERPVLAVVVAKNQVMIDAKPQ
ncbi:flagellar basal body P-ring formation chaperone FlgA [Arenimonas terrae]|nr:flagellar basal body P-ring formation chaperone FlgA [Arenimonas terrae]